MANPLKRAEYSDEVVDKLCLMIESDDYRVSELAKAVGITVHQFNKWVAEKPDFAARVKAAGERRMETFLVAAKSGLLQLLRGVQYDEVTVEQKPDKATGKMVTIFEKTVTKRILPNPAAVIFAMKNLDPEHFDDTIRTEMNGGKNATGEIKPIKVQIVPPTDDPLD